MKAAVFTLVGLLSLCSTGRAEKRPSLLFPEHPTCFELAAAANVMIAQGEDHAVAEIRKRWNAVRMDPAANNRDREQIGWMCRLLYVPKSGSSLRSPAFGAYWFPSESFREADWPCCPLAESDGVFFILAEVYFLGGKAEDPMSYLAYCQAGGIFRQKLLQMPSEREAIQALDHLLQSETWRNIRWNDSGEDAPVPGPTVGYLKAQTKKRANQSPEPTVMSVTPPAAQEPRQP